ncbi:hypothetical protein ACVW0B_000404 [Thermostichus sp. MS-CIW-23]|jgi:hypothetical protein
MVEHESLNTPTKLLLVGVEILFVCALFLMRLGVAGWLLMMFGALLILLLTLWAFVHIALMITFISVFESRKSDIALYLATHFFYLWAWLFQFDGDDTSVKWTIRLLPCTNFLEPLLRKWGGVLFLTTSIATFVCYLIIFILIVIRLARLIFH